MYLSYSGYKTFKTCLRQYWHRYFAKTVLEQPDNRVNSLFGSTVGLAFELFYNQKLWKLPNAEQVLRSRVPEFLKKIMTQEISKGGVYDWKSPRISSKDRSLAAVQTQVEAAITRGFAIIRHHRLLGAKSFAEVKLDSKVNGHCLGGRSDIILRRLPPHDDRLILDGKGSRHGDRYLDADQLIWYANLHEKKLGFLPDRIGFLYWRKKPEEAVSWVPFTRDDIRRIETDALQAISSIEDRKRHLPIAPTQNQLYGAFPESPSESNCAWCTYVSMCPAGQATKQDVPFPDDGEDVSF